MRRRTWIKRSLLVLALVLAVAAGLSYWAFTDVPAYYHRPELTEQERTDAADRAEKKLIRTREWANDLWVREQRSILSAGKTGPDSTPSATSAPATSPAAAHPALTITFTDRELNAFADEWAGSWEQRYRDILKDPVVILQQNRIILAAEVTDLNTVASFHFFPRIDEQGRLLLTLEGVRAGWLPMPDALWAPQRRRVLNGLRRRLPGWQRDARIAPNGVANSAAVAAQMTRLLFDILAGRPQEPVLFIPVDDNGRAVPVRMSAVNLADGTVTLTVEPLDVDERVALLERIRQPLEPPAVASAD